MHSIDNYLLKRFQSIQDWTQQNLSINCFGLARISICIAIIVAENFAIMIGNIFYVLPMLLLGFFVFGLCFLQEKILLQNNHKNNLEYDFLKSRRHVLFGMVGLGCFLIFLFFLKYGTHVAVKHEDVVISLDMFFVIFFVTLCTYWLSCTPLPPSQIKAKNFSKMEVEKCWTK